MAEPAGTLIRLSLSAFGTIAIAVTLSAQQAPPRDNVTAPAAPTAAAPTAVAGSALISGVVLTDEPAPQPVARATVTLSGEGPERTTLSDAMGQFAFDELPAGRYRLTAARPGYVTMSYGALRPGRAGTPLAITAGQRVTGLTVRLPRGAVITGRVTDENGRPSRGLFVRLLRAEQQAGVRTLVPVSLAPAAAASVVTQTDDLGNYPLFGFSAGDYVVSALPQEVFGAARAATAPSSSVYVPVYYPGTATAGEAGVITMAAGEERTGVDVPLLRITAASISGVVTNPAGSPRGSVVRLESREARPPSLIPFDLNATAVGDDGRFAFARVPPGDYDVWALMPATPGLSATAAQSAAPVSWGRAEITVSGTDVRDVTVSLEPALTLTGRVIFDGADPPADTLSRLQIALRPEPAQTVTSVRSAEVIAPGRFRVAGLVPGAYRLTASIAPADAQSWTLASATAGGREAIDLPLEIASGEMITNATVTFTQAVQEVSGVLRNARGQPATDYTLIVFSTDATFWTTGARRTQMARPGTDGRFTVRGLPPGEYFIAALTDVDPSDASDASLLELIAKNAVRFRLGPGEKKVQDFKVGAP